VKRRGQLEVRENREDLAYFFSSFPILVTQLDGDTDVSVHMSLDMDVLPPFPLNVMHLRYTFLYISLW
jgi:hypothetical protein